MEFRALRAPFSDGVKQRLAAFDCGESVVNNYLHGDQPESAAASHIGATYVLAENGTLAGYAALVLSQMRLSTGEKKLHDLAWRDFGALRLAMIGVDVRFQRRGYGAALLEYVAGLALNMGEVVPIRYLVADANPHRHDWYTARGWVDNNSAYEKSRTEASGAISMRYDLHPPS
ncbi:MAG: GNAT family N-acetyltransferase [Solirubrobacteraceae bacterium]|nr:GNAT family N-acetyltransferase [Solirubrobacteraceae bacterium]